jgi:hypothetical protein
MRDPSRRNQSAPAAGRAETAPCDNNPPLDALDYLIATIDAWKEWLKPKSGGGAAGEKEKPAQWPWLRLDNEALWTRIWTVGR